MSYPLDHSGKIYNFMKSNELPECLYCYLVDGWYKRSHGDNNDDNTNNINVLDYFSTSSQINPFSDSQAPTVCLGAAGGAPGVQTMEASKYKAYLAREGEVALEVLTVTFKTENISNVTVNDLAIFTNIYEFTKKIKPLC